MNNLEATSIYQIDEINQALIGAVIEEVYEALVEKGYDPISQMVGYLMSDDPGYITSHNGARSKILKIDRSIIVEEVLRKYLNK